MIDVKYTIRGLDLVDVNPELTADLERVGNKLFGTSVSFPDFNYYEEAVVLMHGKSTERGVGPDGPWARARFRFDGVTRIDSLQGILFEPFSGERRYIQVAENIPKKVKPVRNDRYDPNELWRLNEQFVRGAGADLLTVDSGEEYDTLSLSLNNGTKMEFVYAPKTFIGFQISESTGSGIRSVHYVLAGVDPSIYVPGFMESTREKDVVFNEGLDGAIKPLVQGGVISYRQPKLEHVELVEANRGDKYLVVFEAVDTQTAQHVQSLFAETYGNDVQQSDEAALIVDALNRQSGHNFSVMSAPTFAVDLVRDRKPDSRHYGLTLTTLSTGGFGTQNDIRALLGGSVKKMGSEAGVPYIELV